MSLEINKRLDLYEQKINENLDSESLNKILDDCYLIANKYPKNSKLFYLIGNIMWSKLELEKAIYYFKETLKIDPQNLKAKNKLNEAKKEKLNLITYLTYTNLEKKSSNSIVRAHQRLQEIDNNITFIQFISDEFVINLYQKMQNVIISEEIDTDLEVTQIHRESKSTKFKFYDCKRHFEVFNTFNVIPENCFGCYKISILPRNILEMIKLYLLFDKLNQLIPLTRKCMVELRPGINDPYKAYIYCVGIDEAEKTLQQLNQVLDTTISHSIPRSIKRGCSEFSQSYPDFKIADKEKIDFMNYNPDWRIKEKIIDDKLLRNKGKKISSVETVHGFSLKDFVVISNWLFYAKKIGDQSYNLLCKQPSHSEYLNKKINYEFVNNLQFNT